VGVLQNVIRWFLPEEGKFFDFLDEAAAAADKAARLFQELAIAQGRDAQLALVERIQDAEHDGDKAMRAMADALDATFVTPMDREDLYALCRNLEAISDFISATANHLTVHHMETLPNGTIALADVLAKATGDMKKGVAMLKGRQSPELIRATCRLVHEYEHEADLVFRAELGALFERETNAITLIKHKEFLEGLENAVDMCANAATTLESVLIKNG
jgi:uncharacterized protein Yka (UPF0111/DUF47 family)